MKIICILALVLFVSSVYSEQQTIQELIKVLQKEISRIQTEINKNPEYNSTVIQRITQSGISKYSESGTTQKSMGVMNSYFDMYIKNLEARIKLPTQFQKDFNTFVQKILNDQTEQWIQLNLLFTTETGTKYVLLFARNNLVKKTTDWLITDIKTAFEFATEIFEIIICEQTPVQKLVQGNSTDYSTCLKHTVAKSGDVNNNQVEIIVNFMKLAAYEKIKELSGGPLVLTPQSNDLNGVFTIVNEITSAYAAVAKAFGSSKRTFVKEIIEQKGFNSFAETAETQIMYGLKLKFLPQYLDSLAKRLQIPDGRAADFKDTLETILWSDEMDWKGHSTLFSKDKVSDIKFVYILVKKYPELDKADIVVADMKIAFKLVENLMVIQTDKSIMGGIWTTSKQTIKTVPREITNEELDQMYQFFYVVCLKNIADTIKCPASIPSFSA